MTESIQVNIFSRSVCFSIAERFRLGHSTIDALPDDVLLCIFDFYRRKWSPSSGITWPWDYLAHVCRSWRRVVFGYPHYLKLYLTCNSKADVQTALDIWPALPLRIHADASLSAKDADKDDSDIIDALEHHDRIVGIDLWGFDRSQLEKCIALMQKPFSVLRSLQIEANSKMMFVITDAFLGGSAPLLRSIRFCGIRFPSLPKFLSSTTDLVNLVLEGIPMAGEGHISSDAMITCLSVLTKLRSLTISLRQTSSPYPTYPTDQRPPLSAHAVLPSLTYLSLQSPHRYLEDLLDRIDAPLLNSGFLGFYDDEPMFDAPRIPHTRPFTGITASFISSIGPAELSISFGFSELPAQVAIMERICSQWSLLVSHVEVLKLEDFFYEEERWWEVVTPWPELLRPFTAVQTLRLRGVVTVTHVAHILGGERGEGARGLLPAIRDIEFHCPEIDDSEPLSLLEPFLAARRARNRNIL